MPIISRFLGIVIAIYYDDHSPPHFHARYGNYEITVTIADTIVQGRFPRRGLQLVLEWAALHQAELLDNWERARRHEPLVEIPALE